MITTKECYKANKQKSLTKMIFKQCSAAQGALKFPNQNSTECASSCKHTIAQTMQYTPAHNVCTEAFFIREFNPFDNYELVFIYF